MSAIAPVKLPSMQDRALDQSVSEPYSVHRALPLSLRPGEQVVFAAAQGNKLACAIRDAWQPSFNVTLMTTAELNALSDRCHITFTGSAAEHA
ncbi:MAG: hypothetical protein P4M04_13475 [Acidobacteriota bacterium]|nr:hypothetical protein [Acidobacteriota bacterium]